MTKTMRGKVIDDIINDITNYRATNNVLWMNLLRLAMKGYPKKASATLKSIRANDVRISDLTMELSDVRRRWKEGRHK